MFLSLLGYGNTAFHVSGAKNLLAKNHDSKSGHGMLIQNLPGQKKIAYGFHAGEKASWTSIYGSITINQLGKEFPVGGINEAGLVVEHLYLGASEYPNTDAPSLSELEWIQYQLDNFGSVAEVVSNINRLRIRPLETVHFMIADPCGNAAVIDFIDGEAKIFTQEGTFQVMTQSSYQTARAYHLENKDKIERSGNKALDSYVLLMGHLGSSPQMDLDLSFNLLDIASNKNGAQKTQWNIVYDLEEACIFIKTNSFSQVRRVCLSDFDFESSSKALASPIQTKSLQWNQMNPSTHANLLALGLKHDQLRLDEAAFIQHLMDPSLSILDTVYMQNQVDLVVKFVTNKPSGIVSYIFKPDLQPNQAAMGIKSGQFVVEKKETVRVIYNMPKVQLALACFQDTEFKGPVETKLDASATGFSFLRTQGYHNSGNVPKYVDARIDLRQSTDITVRIK
jgi:choloylglycine hydrolase